eukprot:4180859-Pleurochrysis_carterae.AAC.1
MTLCTRARVSVVRLSLVDTDAHMVESVACCARLRAHPTTSTEASAWISTRACTDSLKRFRAHFLKRVRVLAVPCVRRWWPRSTLAIVRSRRLS